MGRTVDPIMYGRLLSKMFNPLKVTVRLSLKVKPGNCFRHDTVTSRKHTLQFGHHRRLMFHSELNKMKES